MRTLSAVALACMALSSCGGEGEGEGEGEASPSPEPDDASYVAQVCDALLELQDEIADVRESLRTPPAGNAVDLFLPALEHYVATLERADPPGDVEEYHRGVIEATSAAVDDIREKGDLAAFQAAPTPDPPPPGVRERLNAAAAANPHCQEANVDF